MVRRNTEECDPQSSALTAFTVSFHSRARIWRIPGSGVRSTAPSDPAASSSSRRRVPLLIGHMVGQSPHAAARQRGCLVGCSTPPGSALRCLSSHWFLWPPPCTSPALPQLHLATRHSPRALKKIIKKKKKKKSAPRNEPGAGCVCFVLLCGVVQRDLHKDRRVSEIVGRRKPARTKTHPRQ